MYDGLLFQAPSKFVTENDINHTTLPSNKRTYNKSSYEDEQVLVFQGVSKGHYTRQLPPNWYWGKKELVDGDNAFLLSDVPAGSERQKYRRNKNILKVYAVERIHVLMKSSG